MDSRSLWTINVAGTHSHSGRRCPGDVREGDTAVTMQNLPEPLKIGTFVRIRNSGYGRARIVEFRGPLGPKGARVYLVQVRKKPRPAYTEVLEDQLEVESAGK